MLFLRPAFTDTSRPRRSPLLKTFLTRVCALVCCVLPALLLADEQNTVTTGTGWVIAPHFVVTNHHVVGKNNTVTLIRTDNRQVKADVVMRDPYNDVVILKPRKINFLPPGLPIANKAAGVGASVFTIGYPLLGIMGREPKLTTGYISARTGIGNDPRTYQMSVPIQPGNSGGPVFNNNGEVIGIATSSLSAAEIFKWSGNIPQNVNYAIKTNYVRALLDSTPIQSKESVETISHESADLESLVSRVKNSILIVVSGEPKQETAPDNEKATKPATVAKSVQPYALYVFMKPHNYDVRDGNTKQGIDNNINNYSKTVMAMVKDNLQQLSGGSLVPKLEISGKSAKRPLYKAYNEDDRQQVCDDLKVDFLFSAKNDNYSGGQMEITYYVYDCKSRADFYYTKSLDYYSGDSFIYELHLKKILRNMMREKPGNVDLHVS